MHDSPLAPYVYEFVVEATQSSNRVDMTEIYGAVSAETGAVVPLSTSDVAVHGSGHYIGGGGTGTTVLVDGSVLSPYVRWSKGSQFSLGEAIFTLTVPTRLSSLSLAYNGAGDVPTYSVRENGVAIGFAVANVDESGTTERRHDFFPEVLTNLMGVSGTWVPMNREYRLESVDAAAKTLVYNLFYSETGLFDAAATRIKFVADESLSVDQRWQDLGTGTPSPASSSSPALPYDAETGLVKITGSAGESDLRFSFVDPYRTGDLPFASSSGSSGSSGAVPNIPGPTAGSGSFPDLPDVVAPGPDVVLSVASHPNLFDAGNATLRYFFDTNNHALLSIENVDREAGTATLVPRAAFSLVDAFQPAPKMHLTFEGANAGDSSRDVIPAGITVGSYPRGAEGVSAYGTYAADFDGSTYLDTGYAPGSNRDLTVSLWFKADWTDFNGALTDNLILSTRGNPDWQSKTNDFFSLEMRTGNYVSGQASNVYDRFILKLYSFGNGVEVDGATTVGMNTADWHHRPS